MPADQQHPPSPSDRRGHVALVTGSASGIGAATAVAFARQGMHVVVVDIDEDRIHGTVAQIEAVGATATAAVADVGDRTAIGAVIDSVAASLGRLDAVVNCAVSFVARGLDVTGPDWDHVLRVNVQGISNVVQAAHPLLAATEGAAVVNTASVSAHVAQPSRWTYNATKGAIVSLTRCMAMDLAPDGIRVNAVSPGWIWTPEVSRAANGDRARWEPVWGRFHLLRRLGEPEEVATAIAFLCSSDASFITGTDLAVDGGYMAMGPEGLGESSSFASSASPSATSPQDKPDVFGVRLLHVGDGDVPGPEVFWMSDWDQWYTLAFQAVLIQGPGVNVLVNTGPARDLEPMNAQWETFLGPRAAMRRPDGHWIGDLLAGAGLRPGDITHVVLTPLQLYTTSNLTEFTNATIALSERGWTHFHRTKRHPHDDRWSSLPPEVLHHLTHDAWDRVRLLADEDEIVPGIRTWWAGAHHRASVAVEIDSTVGIVTVTDAYFVRRNLDTDHPIGICENIYEALAVHERVRRVADVPLTLYDAEQLVRFPDGIVAPPPPA